MPSYALLPSLPYGCVTATMGADVHPHWPKRGNTRISPIPRATSAYHIAQTAWKVLTLKLIYFGECAGGIHTHKHLLACRWFWPTSPSQGIAGWHCSWVHQQSSFPSGSWCQIGQLLSKNLESFLLRTHSPRPRMFWSQKLGLVPVWKGDVLGLSGRAWMPRASSPKLNARAGWWFHKAEAEVAFPCFLFYKLSFQDDYFFSPRGVYQTCPISV